MYLRKTTPGSLNSSWPWIFQKASAKKEGFRQGAQRLKPTRIQCRKQSRTVRQIPPALKAIQNPAKLEPQNSRPKTRCRRPAKLKIHLACRTCRLRATYPHRKFALLLVLLPCEYDYHWLITDHRHYHHALRGPHSSVRGGASTNSKTSQGRPGFLFRHRPRGCGSVGILLRACTRLSTWC